MDILGKPTIQNPPPLTPTQKSLQLTLSKEVASLKNLLDSAAIPADKRAEFRARLGELQDRIRRAQNAAAGSNLQTALNGAVKFADAVVGQRVPYCVFRIDVGFDASAVKEAVTLVMEKHKDLAVMIFSVDEHMNKVLVYAGVPASAAKRGLIVWDWLRVSLAPIEGIATGGKNGLAQGQGVRVAGIDEALATAKTFATKIFAK